MEKAKEIYEMWKTDKYFDQTTRDELESISDNPEEINERFYKYLEFGTGGLRGIIGAGTNRINNYTIALATEAFARYIDSLDLEQTNKSIAISYDSRKYSEEFALKTALVFATHNIKVYLSDELRPTPMLSFAVRHFNTAGGVMVTASHNPAKYNGYKAYGNDGGQMTPEAADQIIEFMQAIDDIREIKHISKQEALSKGLLVYFGSEFDDVYCNMLSKLIINQDAINNNSDMKIVFTPLHGTANKPVMKILEKIGFKNAYVVPEQALPDSQFSTVESPNPEERSALKMAIDLAQAKGADLVLATDPDGDRTGLALKKSDGEYIVLTGNQIGLLLMDYILRAKREAGTLSDKSFAVTTIVSTKLTRRIASEYGIKLFEVLTGFKYIGEIIKDYDENGDMNFEFGFEESYGFLAGTDVRDKDDVVAVMLIAEMAASARSEGKTLYDILLELYSKYGYAAEKTISIALEGIAGLEKIKSAMNSLRQDDSGKLNGVKIQMKSDYLTSKIIDYDKKEISVLDLEKSNVLLYSLGDLDWFCVRPSGTEPKLKIYFGIYGDNKDICDKKLEEVSGHIIEGINKILE